MWCVIVLLVDVCSYACVRDTLADYPWGLWLVESFNLELLYTNSCHTPNLVAH
jgi:hypothetical protein